MKLGLSLSLMGAASRPEVLLACARAADEAGLDELWVPDHIAIPPDDAEGSDGRYLDPLTSLAYLAGLAFGGLGWAFSGGDPSVAEAVIAPAIHGDYVVTPAHLRGERSLAFVGMAEPVEPTEVMLGRDDPQDEYQDSYYDRAP